MEKLPTFTACQSCNGSINTKMVDTLNSLVSDHCYGRTPVYPFHCNDSVNYQSLIMTLNNFSSSISPAFDDELGSGRRIDACTASQIDLLTESQCAIGSYCIDDTCDCCNSLNLSLSSWYGELAADSQTSIVIWYNNEVCIMTL